MGLFDVFKKSTIKEPIFDKDFDRDENLQLKILTDLLDKVGDDQKPLIENEIKLVKIGLQGENNVIYELKNSFLPLICLHDITIKYQNLSAQLDFVIITQHFICVIESKKLIGDIEINSDGDFIRVFKTFEGKIFKKEGMPSPITQNQRHIDILATLLREKDIIRNIPILSLVVIANPKQIVNKAYAPNNVKEQVIKYDQLTVKLKSLINEYSNYKISDKQMIEISNFLRETNVSKEYDYITRFNLKIKEDAVDTEETKDNKADIEVIEDVDKAKKKYDDALYEELRTYRAEKAKEHDLKPYFIFNNDQLGELVISKPTNKDEFLKISGFALKKYEQYGVDIINIILKYTTGETTLYVEEKEEDMTDSTDSLYLELKRYRFEKSESLNIKPYYIFNNDQLDKLVSLKPLTKKGFLMIDKMDEDKFDKYGEDIINIIKKYVAPEPEAKVDAIKEETNSAETNSDPLYTELKQYRLNKAIELNLKAYEIFTNKQLDSFVESKPTSKEEIMKVEYFNEFKFNKYGEDIISIIKKHVVTETDESSNDIEQSPLYKALRKYRYDKSQAQNVKPYIIFTNEELTSIVESKPTTKEELISIKGFGEKKFESYGQEILEIIKKIK